MNKLLKIKKGLDLNLAGAISDKSVAVSIKSGRLAVVPDDFPGLTPRLDVKEGDKVAKGQSLAHDKTHEEIKLCSPVSGIVSSIIRGERRKILSVIIDADDTNDEIIFNLTQNPDKGEIRHILLESGLWSRLRQLPYDIVPHPEREPRDIFVTAFDSAPLAGDLLKNPSVNQENIKAGVEALKKLTKGKVYISARENFPYSCENAELITIQGPHPAGLPSIQAGNIKPINKGETVWMLDIVTLSKIGELISSGQYSTETLVAVTGSEISDPHYVLTTEGAEIESLIKDSIAPGDKNRRIISGNVLSGKKTEKTEFLRFPHRQITVIPEGNDKDEFMGWASISPSKLSASRSYPLSRFKAIFSPDARLNGGKRAMIMSGLYDRMIPLDIMAEYLIKAVLSRNIEKMEQLGIYEVSPEDFALAEFVDPSKLELQKIIRSGLDYMRKETED
ncbi:MAG: Na(+)-translocating NADH-quinone reductase subunit A [Paramuribaculum sp.]|nr:Na(+)-translocating NADH-quinone reductase subunit A [Paramuribaculum sp.]